MFPCSSAPLVSQTGQGDVHPALSSSPGPGTQYIPTQRLQSLGVTYSLQVRAVGPRKREVHFSAPLGLCMFILYWVLQIL